MVGSFGGGFSPSLAFGLPWSSLPALALSPPPAERSFELGNWLTINAASRVMVPARASAPTQNDQGDRQRPVRSSAGLDAFASFADGFSATAGRVVAGAVRSSASRYGAIRLTG